MNNKPASIAGAHLSVKSWLYPLLTHPRIAQVIKWTVYGALLINFGLYVIDDIQVHIATQKPDASFADVLVTYSTSIDMLGWVGLVLLFELETYSLPDEAFRRWVPAALRTGRLLCYISIAYAGYGYTYEALENHDITLIDGLSDICDVAESGTYLQTNAVDYTLITADNCKELSDDNSYYRVADETAITPASVALHSQRIGWLDVINAAVWLIVVFLIEVEVWMQSRDRFASRALSAIRATKTLFYLNLIGNGVIWMFTGYPLYAWDAFLWIFGFWAIELNLAEWERDRTLELSSNPTGTIS